MLKQTKPEKRTWGKLWVRGYLFFRSRKGDNAPVRGEPKLNTLIIARGKEKYLVFRKYKLQGCLG